MMMRLTWGKLRSGTWSDFEQAYHTTVVGRDIKGLRGRWLAQDINDSDGGFAVSLWESEEDMQAYEQSDFYQQKALPALQPYFAGEYTTYRCEVKYSQ